MIKKIILTLVVLIGGVTLLPIELLAFILTRPFDKKSKVINFFSKLWGMWLVYGNIGCTLKIEGKENLEKGKTYVLVANHNTLYDIPMVHFLNINFRWVSKREVLKIPIIGLVLAMQRSITIRRGDPNSARKMLATGEKILRSGVSVAVFPEGTRSKTGEMGKFKGGAFIMAKSAEVEILPVVLFGSRDALLGNPRRTKLRIKILPAVPSVGRKASELAKELNDKFSEELQGSSENSLK